MLGAPPLPPGPPPGDPFGRPPLPPGMPGVFGMQGKAQGGAPVSQADFAAEMRQLGFAVPAPALQPPGPPPRPNTRPPGPPPRPKVTAPAGSVAKVPEMPDITKAPPPPAKKAAPASSASVPRGQPRAATLFTPTTLRTKKPSQVAGGVYQVSSNSLSQEARQKTLSQEVPRVAEKVNIDEAFDTFMSELE
mmetsp:Transcript_95721/g.212918  ORF Transcript_95721/g.212918 Transcript_95721/m.212918 type:complete len:191 (+) Transcript_95721:3-575(+)